MGFLKKLFGGSSSSSNNNQPKKEEAPAFKPQTFTFTFNKLPESLEEFKALPEANLDTPFKSASLVMIALMVWLTNKNLAIEMLNYLKGPSPMTPRDVSFLNDRFMDNGKYIPSSYFRGSSVNNNYTPNIPYVLDISTHAHSLDTDGYISLNLTSSGADSPRQIKLRKQGSTGKWFLWEQFVMVGIKTPKEADPWA